MQGKQRAKKRKECSEFAAKQMDKFKKGKSTDILQYILRRRMPIDMLHRVENSRGELSATRRQ